MTNLCKNFFFAFDVKMCMFSADKYIYFLISLRVCDSPCRNTDVEFKSMDISAARLDISFFHSCEADQPVCTYLAWLLGNTGSVWQRCLNNSFCCLNNTTRISTIFFFHPHVFPQHLNNITRITLPNRLIIFLAPCFSLNS